jgi:hypothetical protein
MADRPHIFFATPGVAHRHRSGGGVPKLHRPTGGRQVSRLDPQFGALERAFEQQQAQLRADVPGIEPEEMLVFETVGRVEEFVKALGGLHGLEWLGDVDLDDLSPDEDFYSEQDPDQGLPGRLYLIMSNQRGLNELLRLWALFKEDSTNPRFERGRTKWRDLFRLLREVRPWGPEDRLRTTGFADELGDRVAAAPELVTAELELWFRADASVRARAQEAITRLTDDVLGHVTASSVIPEIQYHGILVELPFDSARAIIRDHVSPLVRAAQVLKIRPVGQTVALGPEGDAEAEGALTEETPRVDDREPIVALLDGLPLQQHQRLTGRLRVDDPDDWDARYPVASRVHGTAMASLVIHGDLGAPDVPLDRAIYVRPILQPALPEGPRAREGVPDDSLSVDLVYRAITRIFRGVGGYGPVAPSIRIINHSVADPRRSFDYTIGAWARALDHLAAQHHVLIVVSAGNVDLPLDLEVGGDDEPGGELSRAALEAVARAPWARRLLSPAEGMNVLTVGSTHDDQSVDGTPGTLVDLFPRSGPSPYSRHGPGYRRSIKPELVLPGGRALFMATRADGNGRRTFQIRDVARAPGQLVATPGLPGRLDQVQYSRGTSNSTALASRAAARLFEMLERLRTDPGGERLRRDNEGALLKALLVHGASQPPGLAVDGEADDALRVRLVGYGQLDLDRVLASADNRVTLIGWGVLQDGDASQFKLPLPPSLSGVTAERRVTVTLAWMAPINPRHRAYRRASLWFDPYGTGSGASDDLMKTLGLRRMDGDYSRPRRGTVQHEVFTGTKAAVFEEGRSAIIQVNCRSETGDLGTTRVPFGLVVTVETPAQLPIYDEIRTRLRPPIQVAVGAPANAG